MNIKHLRNITTPLFAFNSISTFAGLSYAFVSLTVGISNYKQYKNLSSQLFSTGKYFTLSYNINVFRANVLMSFKIISNIISNKDQCDLWIGH